MKFINLQQTRDIDSEIMELRKDKYSFLNRTKRSGKIVMTTTPMTPMVQAMLKGEL